MAFTINVALVEEPEVPDETKMLGDCACDEVHGLSPKLGSFIAVTEISNPALAPDKQSQRWKDALDRLLLVSFGSISPAYLFRALPIES